MDSFQGKVAVVTGAASGIGRALAGAFAAEGAAVVLADIEADPLEEAAAEVEGLGVDALAVPTDVRDAAAVDALRDAALDRFGAVHVVCNNAGVSTGGRLWEHSVEDWDWLLGVNLMGVVHGVRAFTPTLIEQGEGHIVNTASVAGLLTPPFLGLYNVTKHAVVALSETLYGELALVEGADVGVSVLCPGWVATRIHESHRNRPAADEVDGTEGEDAFGAGFAEVAAGLIANGLAPTAVAGMVLDAVRERRFYILTHPDWTPLVADRVERIVRGDAPSGAGLPMDLVDDGTE